MSNWIRTSERLPRLSEDYRPGRLMSKKVLIYRYPMFGGEKGITTAFLFEGRKGCLSWWDCEGHIGIDKASVSHWMELPEDPEDDE